MAEITELLRQAHAGDKHALGDVFDRLYPELRRIATSHAPAQGRTLTPTVLVHEAYVRLLGNERLTLANRHHFLACAARAMRGALVDYVRRITAAKRGGSAADLDIDDLAAVLSDMHQHEDLLALDNALDRLDAVSPRQREVVELRYFTGLEFGEIAQLLDCSERTAKREWERARAFLYNCMAPA